MCISIKILVCFVLTIWCDLVDTFFQITRHIGRIMKLKWDVTVGIWWQSEANIEQKLSFWWVPCDFVMYFPGFSLQMQHEILMWLLFPFAGTNHGILVLYADIDKPHYLLQWHGQRVLCRSVWDYWFYVFIFTNIYLYKDDNQQNVYFSFNQCPRM